MTIKGLEQVAFQMEGGGTKIGNERGGSHYMGTMANGAIVPFFERKPCDGERLK